jgi:hypothetical protein
LAFVTNTGGSAENRQDWYVETSTPETRNDELWGKGTTKTIFDPCPSGWRIAPNGTWSDFTSNGGNAPTAEAVSGTLFAYYINGVQQTEDGTPLFGASARNGRRYDPETGDVLAWFPVAGRRHVSSGEFQSIGDMGQIWSSSASSTGSTGYNLQFSMGISKTINHLSELQRGWGFSVRCLQE